MLSPQVSVKASGGAGTFGVGIHGYRPGWEDTEGHIGDEGMS